MEWQTAKIIQWLSFTLFLAGSLGFCMIMNDLKIDDHMQAYITVSLFLLNISFFIAIKKGVFDCCIEEHVFLLPGREGLIA